MSEKTNTPRMTMSENCKHAQHQKCESAACWCACHPTSLPPSSDSQSVEQATAALRLSIMAFMESAGALAKADEVIRHIDALVLAVDASAYARGRADAGQEETPK